MPFEVEETMCDWCGTEDPNVKILGYKVKSMTRHLCDFCAKSPGFDETRMHISYCANQVLSQIENAKQEILNVFLVGRRFL